MTLLIDAEFPRTLDTLLDRFTRSPTATLEAWLFEDLAARQAAERRLAAAGVRARIRSAYKPLLHAFLEEVTPRGEVVIELPTGDTPGRWRLEAYPLAGLFPDCRFTFVTGTAPWHHVVHVDGQVHRVFTPNCPRPNHLGASAITPCGWLRAGETDAPLETEHEALFAAGMQAILAHSWPTRTPHFATLAIDIEIAGIERPLPWHDEVLSTREALHEDFYFSVLEALKHRAGLAAADRSLQPGQIVPDVRAAQGPARIRIAALEQPPGEYILAGPASLDDADRPLTPRQIDRELARLGGRRSIFRSVQGRDIPCHIIDGAAPAVVITAAQHANETSGVVGALRAAHRLAAAAEGSFAVIPCDNPDGYALHHRLRAANPRHMHHAARYSALGDDIEARDAPPYFERDARMQTIAALGARLHINLHGYPAHEWTRPFSAYLPAGFELWTIPKGFFLILRHAPGLREATEGFARALAAELASDPALRAFNDSQLAVWTAHAGTPAFPVFDSIPCMISEAAAPLAALQLITEYPDETIYGDPFRLAHTTQMRATLAAVRLFRAMFPPA